MKTISNGSVFAAVGAFFIGVIGCFDASPQKQMKPAEARVEIELVLAVGEPPERSEDSQPRRAETDQESRDGEVVEIPLDQIWALDMPGTYKLTANKHNGTGEYVSAEGPILHDIFRSFHALKDGEQSKPGFAVAGTAMDALRNVRAVLTGEQKPSMEFDTTDEVTIVFFSLEFGTDVHLDEVTRRDNRVEIRYRFVPHLDAGVSSNMALIPLGRLPLGETTVELVPSMDDKFVDWKLKPIPNELASRVVCKPFRFVVSESAVD